MSDEFIPFGVVPKVPRLDEGDMRLYQELYNMPYNQGMLEGYVNPQDVVVGGNVGNTTYTPVGAVNIGGGATYQPTSENKINPYAFATLYANNAMFRALMDENIKQVSGNIGPLSAVLTKTPEELVKEYALNLENLGVRMVSSPYGKSYEANVNVPIGPGQLSANAYKNNWDKGLFINYEMDF